MRQGKIMSCPNRINEEIAAEKFIDDLTSGKIPSSHVLIYDINDNLAVDDKRETETVREFAESEIVSVLNSL